MKPLTIPQPSHWESGFDSQRGQSDRLPHVLLSTVQMTEADRLTIAYGINAITLMENAGRPVADAIMNRWSLRPVLVLCGPGNNGGDGFVAARHLAEANWPVRVALLGTRDQLRGSAAHHASLWNGPVETLTPDALNGAELIVDAIFGAGLTRPLEGAAVETLAAAAAKKLTIIAVDVPSGLMGDTGENMGAVSCALTLTCFRKKPGHLLQPGKSLCGELVVANIGTPASVFVSIPPDTFENHPALWADNLPLLNQHSNKYSRGHALVWGGWPTTGAARMAALSAARVGAGLTTIAVDMSQSYLALSVYAATLTCIMVKPIHRHQDLAILLGDKRITGLLIGPGAGVGPDTQARVLTMLKSGQATVLDADALTSFQHTPTDLFDAITGPCVLTPHEGEFSRLFKGVVDSSYNDKLSRARAAAKASGAIVILKGNDTVIAAPDGRAIINANAPSTLATAGSGDVLAGIALGLLTQGMEPFLAAAAAVWLQGAAANNFGPGLIAEDLPYRLPAVFKQLALLMKQTDRHFSETEATIEFSASH
ncbi:NAD(P)H-hydrate dehydratase [Marinomonas sp. ef1]|uniref:NAD(P)H-hydrate dehydratase n=1 Tax=Marinomonas sp. ef1 TaxID=2005043 RepID=UPI000C29528E|nr:NAD(P)H-hydrate dehydratase [Marinomonas sp. ef1]